MEGRIRIRRKLKLTRFFRSHVMKKKWSGKIERRLIRVCMYSQHYFVVAAVVVIEGEKIAKEIKHFPHDSPFTLMENEKLVVD